MDALLAASGAAVALGPWAAHAFWRRRFGYPPAGLPAVLAYHKVGSAELGGTWCTRRQFAAHLEAMQSAGWRALDLATFDQRLEQVMARREAESSPGAASRARKRGHEARAARVPSEAEPRRGGAERPPPGSIPLPAAARAASEVLLTFDDAWANFASHAFPELEKRRFPVVLFVVSDCVGQRARWDLPLPGRRALHLDWPALRDLVAAGVEIGSHSETHRDLRRLPTSELQRELSGSRRRLEDALGVPVRAISYPFGRFDAAVLTAAAGAGYSLGFTMCPPWHNARVEPLALRRWGVYITDAPRCVLDKLVPARRGFWFQDLMTRGINAVAEISARFR